VVNGEHQVTSGKKEATDPRWAARGLDLFAHPPTLYIIGAGGIGCAVGFALAAARPVIVDANVDKVRWGQANGLVLDRRPPVPASFVHFEDWRPEPGATVLLCTKCYDNAAVLARLPEGVALIPIQNGFDPALQPRADGIEGIASFVSECHPQRTHTRITRRGALHLGSRHGDSDAARARLQQLAGLLRRAPFRVHVVADILPFKYTKLMYNAAISPLAAAAGIDNGQLLAVPLARRLFFALLRENFEILAGAGLALARIGPFHPRTVQRILRHRSLANLLAFFFYPSLRGSYCSMSGDLPRGRTEIEYYNRHLIDVAGQRPCPLNQRVYDLVKRMERDRLAPGLQWLQPMADVIG
jgi:2-dehydropantoate 2-reductase